MMRQLLHCAVFDTCRNSIHMGSDLMGLHVRFQLSIICSKKNPDAIRYRSSMGHAQVRHRSVTG